MQALRGYADRQADVLKLKRSLVLRGGLHAAHWQRDATCAQRLAVPANHDLTLTLLAVLLRRPNMGDWHATARLIPGMAVSLPQLRRDQHDLQLWCQGVDGGWIAR